VAIATLELLVLDELKKTYSGEIEINIVPRVNDTDNTLEYEVIQASINRVADKEKRVKTAYEDGIDTLDEYKENKARLTAEREDLKNALKLLKMNLIENKHNGEIVSRITSVYEILTDDMLDIESKYQTAHMLIEQITYSRAEKSLKLTYK
jgi:hypothetical protein